MRGNPSSILPGFGLTVGYTIFYLSLVVLIPLSAMIIKASSLTAAEFLVAAGDPRAIAAYGLTFGASLIAALTNSVFGLIVAWMLVRYDFPGKRIIDALVDLPFALPTAVSGITLAALYSKTGWIGRWLEPAGIETAYSRLGIVIALTFVGLPFVIRSLQPAIADLDWGAEEAAMILGASRWQAFVRVILPLLVPAMVSGFAMSLARALGEYGSVIFIAGNMPMKTEVASLLIVAKLEQFDYAGATAIGSVLLLASFAVLLGINSLQWLRSRRMHRGTP